jgi:hypothetical protein
MLLKILFFLKFAFQIAFVANFGDDVAISIACEYFVTFEDVGVIELLEYINLRKEKFF